VQPQEQRILTDMAERGLRIPPNFCDRAPGRVLMAFANIDKG